MKIPWRKRAESLENFNVGLDENILFVRELKVRLKVRERMIVKRLTELLL